MKRLLLIAAALCVTSPAFAFPGKCVGAADCKVCKNCNSCDFCAKKGGTCGVKRMGHPSNSSTHKSTSSSTSTSKSKSKSSKKSTTPSSTGTTTNKSNPLPK